MIDFSAEALAAGTMSVALDLLANEMLNGPHHENKDELWRWKTFSFNVFFDLPRDEFTERLNLGIPLGPEGIALRDDLELELQANPKEAEVEVLDVKLESLRILELLEGGEGAEAPVTMMLPVKARIRYPEPFVNDTLAYLEKHVSPRLTVPFLGVASLPGTLSWGE